MCPYFEVSLQLRDETPFFVNPYPIREEQKHIVQREMDRLEKLGIIEKGLTGYSSPVLLVKRKQQNLYRVATDFRVLNERLVRINHAFPLVRDCLDAIGNSECQVFTVIDLRDAYHTLRLAKESQKFLGITPFYGSPTYKARHTHKHLYTVLPKYSKIQVLPGITSCRLMKDNKQAIELNDLLKK